jgi:hypothetical protein
MFGENACVLNDDLERRNLFHCTVSSLRHLSHMTLWDLAEEL